MGRLVGTEEQQKIKKRPDPIIQKIRGEIRVKLDIFTLKRVKLQLVGREFPQEYQT